MSVCFSCLCVYECVSWSVLVCLNVLKGMFCCLGKGYVLGYSFSFIMRCLTRDKKDKLTYSYHHKKRRKEKT